MKLIKREERPEQYDANRDINNLIAETLKKSISDYVTKYEGNTWYSDGTKEKIKCAKEYFGVPYAETTLGKSGCAVFCFEHGLRTRGIKRKIETLAKEIGRKGYYYPGKGTWHNLFDHYGLRRATSVWEIFDAIHAGKIVTLLLRNEVYDYSESDEGTHFVNIVETSAPDMFVVEDPNWGTVYVPIKNILKATQVAWVW